MPVSSARAKKKLRSRTVTKRRKSVPPWKELTGWFGRLTAKNGAAMRPHPDQIQQYLKEDEYKVYKLIWQRFVASQITPAVFDQTTVDIDAKSASDTFWFRVTGSVQKFDGFLKVYEESKEGKDEEDEELKHKLPPLEPGQKLTM